MVSLRRCIALAAAAFVVPAAADYKYMIEFVACEDLHCQGHSIVEQHAPWKYVEDGECKSYHGNGLFATAALRAR